MSRKSRAFLGSASIAMAVALAVRLLPALPGSGLADFATGLATGLLFGVLITWKDGRSTHV